MLRHRLFVIAGFGPLLAQSLAGPVTTAIRAAATVFSITIGLDLLVAPLVWFLERGVMRVTGMKVEY